MSCRFCDDPANFELLIAYRPVNPAGSASDEYRVDRFALDGTNLGTFVDFGAGNGNAENVQTRNGLVYIALTKGVDREIRVYDENTASHTYDSTETYTIGVCGGDNDPAGFAFFGDEVFIGNRGARELLVAPAEANSVCNDQEFLLETPSSSYTPLGTGILPNGDVLIGTIGGTVGESSNSKTIIRWDADNRGVEFLAFDPWFENMTSAQHFLTVLETGPGDFTDFNNNGIWDLPDLNLVLFNWQQPEASLPVEWIKQRPAVVDLASLNLVLFNWQQASSIAAVPEPAGWGLVITGLVLLWGRRRRPLQLGQHSIGCHRARA